MLELEGVQIDQVRSYKLCNPLCLLSVRRSKRQDVHRHRELSQLGTLSHLPANLYLLDRQKGWRKVGGFGYQKEETLSQLY